MLGGTVICELYDDIDLYIQFVSCNFDEMYDLNHRNTEYVGVQHDPNTFNKGAIPYRGPKF